MSSLEERASKITESELNKLQEKAENSTISEEEFIVWYFLRIKEEENIITTESKAREQYRSYKVEFGIR